MDLPDKRSPPSGSNEYNGSSFDSTRGRNIRIRSRSRSQSRSRSNPKSRNVGRSRSRSRTRERGRSSSLSRERRQKRERSYSDSDSSSSSRQRKQKKKKKKKSKKKSKKSYATEYQAKQHDNSETIESSRVEKSEVKSSTNLNTETVSDAKSFFSRLKDQESSKEAVGTVHARGFKAVSATAVTDEWECVKRGCGNKNSKYAPACTKCGAMKRMSEWR